MKAAVSLIFLSLSLCSVGQDNSSVSEKLEERYFLHYEKMTDFQYSNLDSAQVHAEQLLKLSSMNGDSVWMAAGYEGLGYVRFYRDELDEALPYFQKQRDLLIRNADPVDVSLAYMNIGNTYSGMTRYDLGIQNYLKAASLLPDDPEYDIDRAYLNYNLSNTLMDFEDFTNAEKYLEIANEFARKNEIKDLYPSIFNMTAELALQSNNAGKALAITDSSLKYSRQNNDLIEEIYATELRARAKIRLGNNEDAIKLQKESLRMCKIYGDPYLTVVGLAYMAEILMESDELEKALTYAEEAYLMKDDQHSLIGKKKATKVYALVLGRLGRHEQQVKYYEEYMVYQDSIHHSNLNESILEAQNKTYSENNALLRESTALQQTVIKRNKLIRLILVVALLLAVILVTVIGFMNRRRKAVNIQLVKNQSMLDEKKQALEIANQQLEDLNQGKDKLLSILTHDIKQPFNQTLGVLELLDVYTEDNEELHAVLKQVRESVKNDKKNVENLLIWSKSQFVKITPHPTEVDCSEVTFKVINELKTTIQEKKIDVNLDISKECKLLADPYHFEIILRNLITNAIKFSHLGGKLDISSESNKEKMEIKIQDDGIGMSESELSKLFDQNKHFSKNGTLNEAGTGLGMLVVYDFVKENKGEIEVESTPDQGSTFRLRFPAA